MSNAPDEVDLLVAKMTAMEVVLLTMIRPLAQNPKFWEDVNSIAKAFEDNTRMNDLRERRWTATRGFIEEWRRALTPPPQQPPRS